MIIYPKDAKDAKKNSRILGYPDFSVDEDSRHVSVHQIPKPDYPVDRCSSLGEAQTKKTALPR